MAIESYLVPSETIHDSASELGVAPDVLMRDFYSIGSPSPNIKTLVVGDMANNLTGQMSHLLPNLAARLHLPPEYRFNTGLLGSRTFREQLGHFATTGTEFIADANRTLTNMYAELDMVARGDADRDRAELATGCATQAHIGPDRTIITSVGDVYAWVNGDRVAGQEKEIDVLKDKLITDLLEGWGKSEDRMGVLTRYVDGFRVATQLGVSTTYKLVQVLHGVDSTVRQEIYSAIDRIVTPWQIRTLQNNQSSYYKLRYGAIDGTETPEEFIETREISTSEIDSIVLGTDGTKPLGDRVVSRSDLVAANPKYGEQAIVVWQRDREG